MSPTKIGLLQRGTRPIDIIAETFIRLSAVLVILSLILIFLFIGKEALPVLISAEVHKEVDPVGLFSKQRCCSGHPERFIWQPVSERPKYCIIPLIIGTLKVTFVALFVAIPLGLAAAIFTSEFAPAKIRELIKPVIELLAGVPSVVLGFFALMVMATWLQDIFGWTFRLNAITAGIGMGLAVIPIVYTISEDALLAVPQAYRDGSTALGANTWQTTCGVVIPAALPGILAACVLGFGRAIGETMIVLMASGNAALSSLNPAESLRSFSATIAAELAEVVVGSPHYHVLFFIGAFLFLFTFLTNLAGHWYVGKLKAKLQGAPA
jgi:phosphate transport system permease protein